MAPAVGQRAAETGLLSPPLAPPPKKKLLLTLHSTFGQLACCSPLFHPRIVYSSSLYPSPPTDCSTTVLWFLALSHPGRLSGKGQEAEMGQNGTRDASWREGSELSLLPTQEPSWNLDPSC